MRRTGMLKASTEIYCRMHALVFDMRKSNLFMSSYYLRIYTSLKTFEPIYF